MYVYAFESFLGNDNCVKLSISFSFSLSAAQGTHALPVFSLVGSSLEAQGRRESHNLTIIISYNIPITIPITVQGI